MIMIVVLSNTIILAIEMIIITISFLENLTYQYSFLRLFLNVLRLVALLILSGILFQNTEPVKYKSI